MSSHLIEFDHEKLHVYRLAIDFVAWLAGLKLNATRTPNAFSHLQRASSGIPLNIAEFCGKSSSKGRRHMVDIAYGSALECAGCIDILIISSKIPDFDGFKGKQLLASVVSLLLGLRRSVKFKVEEESCGYNPRFTDETKVFSHEKLNVYSRALDFIRWLSKFEERLTQSKSTFVNLEKAAVAIILNIAEGNGRFTVADRRRFIGYSRTAALHSAAVLDVMSVRFPQTSKDVYFAKSLLVEVVRMLIVWGRSLDSCPK